MMAPHVIHSILQSAILLQAVLAILVTTVDATRLLNLLDDDCSLEALRSYFVGGPGIAESGNDDGGLCPSLNLAEHNPNIIERVLRSKTPVLLRNVERLWPDVDEATRAWRPDSLVAEYGSRHIAVQISSSVAGHFDCARRELPCSELVEEMSVRDFFAGRPPAAAAGSVAYWQNNEIADSGVEELAMAPPFTNTEIVSHRQWVSRDNVSAAFHFDYDPNFVLVRQGAKTFYTYDMFQSAFLAPGLSLQDDFHTAVQFGAVDPRIRSRKRYPRFENARGWRCTARKGDLLFIPAYHWHFVETNVENDKFAIAINWFVHAPKEDRLPDKCYRELPYSIADFVLEQDEDDDDDATKRLRARRDQFAEARALHDLQMLQEDFYEEEDDDDGGKDEL